MYLVENANLRCRMTCGIHVASLVDIFLHFMHLPISVQQYQ